MKPFEYIRPETVADAVAAAATHGDAAFLGGGTNLVDLMKLDIERPERLIDVRRLGLSRIGATANGLSIGAAVANADLAANDFVRERYPMVSAALLSGAAPQIRNKATTAGNLLQRVRCAYFYDSARRCNKRAPGSGCDALHGLERARAIFGADTSCVATHPSDLAVALVTLDAIAVTARHETSGRRIPVEDLLRLPDGHPERDHILEPGEIILHVELPPAPSQQVFRKVRERASFEFATASIGLACNIASGRLSDVRLTLGGVAHKPWRARAAERLLEGAVADVATARQAAAAALTDAAPGDDDAGKVRIVERLIVATLRDLSSRPEAEGDAA